MSWRNISDVRFAEKHQVTASKGNHLTLRSEVGCGAKHNMFKTACKIIHCSLHGAKLNIKKKQMIRVCATIRNTSTKGLSFGLKSLRLNFFLRVLDLKILKAMPMIVDHHLTSNVACNAIGRTFVSPVSDKYKNISKREKAKTGVGRQAGAKRSPTRPLDFNSLSEQGDANEILGPGGGCPAWTCLTLHIAGTSTAGVATT